MKKLLLISLGTLSCLYSFYAHALNFNASLLDDNLYTQNTLVPDSLFGNDSYQIAKTYFLPDYQAKVVSRASNNSGNSGDKDNSCSDYGFEACEAPKMLKPGAKPVHPVQGLDCYKKSDCICPAEYKYTDDNCFKVVNGTRKTAVGPDKCNGKSNTCTEDASFKYFYLSRDSQCYYKNSCSGCPNNSAAVSDPQNMWVNSLDKMIKVKKCRCSDSSYPHETKIDNANCNSSCTNSEGKTAYYCICNNGYTCSNGSGASCSAECVRDCPAAVTCPPGQKEIKSTKTSCGDITVGCCPAPVGTCDYGCSTYSDTIGCTEICTQCNDCKPDVNCTAENYPLTTRPVNANYEQCSPGCSDNTQHYKIKSCNEGYSLNGSKTLCEKNKASGAVIFTYVPTTTATLNIPVTSVSGSSFTIDWGDGFIEENLTTNASHSYNSGNYTVKITGDVVTLGKIKDESSADASLYITSVKQLDLSSIVTLSATFDTAKNLTGSIPSLPKNLKSATYAFAETGITGITSLPDTLNDANYMFYKCSSLTGTAPALPSALKRARNMFYKANLTALPPSFPAELEDASYMFSYNQNMTGSIPSLKNTSINKGFAMFDHCNKLTGNVPELPASLTDAIQMFDGCSGLTGNIPQLNHTALTTTVAMFRNCTGLTGNIPALPASLVSADEMFRKCSKLSGNISEMKHTALKTANYMFSECSGLSGRIPEFPASLEKADYMFYKTSNLSGNIPAFPAALKSAQFMFYEDSKLTGSIPSLAGTFLENGEDMFYKCTGLSGNVPELPSTLTNARAMFKECANLSGGIPELGHTSIKIANDMFKNCKGLNGNIKSFPKTLTNAGDMFYGCNNLIGSIPSLLHTSLSYAPDMFENCSNLTGSVPELPDTLIEAGRMFYNCKNLTGYIPKLPSALKNAVYMFAYCGGLSGVDTVNGQYPYQYLSILSGNDMVHSCKDSVKKHFPVNWGGTCTSCQ